MLQFLTSVDTNGSDSTIADIEYTYDRLHNPTGKDDTGPVLRDKSFTYDALSRLVSFDPEGTDNTTDWELTAVGNWRKVKYDDTTIDLREHNPQNEITLHKEGTSQVTVKPKINGTDSYDLEGNLCEVPFDNAGTESQYLKFVYDAWNRLVGIADLNYSVVRAAYERDGLGRIIVNNSTDEHHYYSASWQLLSTFDDNLEDDGLVKEYVWGPRYVDEIAATINYGGSGNARFYHMQDANWNVIFTLSNAGAELEAFQYDPYGKSLFYVKSNNNWIPSGDLSSVYGTDMLFQGRWYETFNVSGSKLRLYHFRNRAYGPELGRFLQRDPIGVWGDGAMGRWGDGAMERWGEFGEWVWVYWQ